MRHSACAIARIVGLVLSVLLPSLHCTRAQAETLTIWSHWADQQAKVALMEGAARAFEKSHPGTEVKITWYQKGPLFTALQGALRARRGPDIFYLDPDRSEFFSNGLALPLDGLLDWSNVDATVREAWKLDGKTYGLPLEISTLEVYYDTALLAKLGMVVPESLQFDQSSFAALVRKAAAAGITPIVAGVGDRPFPGSYVLQELMLKRLGREEYGALLDGKLPYSDKRVAAAIRYFKELVDVGAYPRSFSTLKLGEAHSYFYGTPGGLMLPMPNWFPSRAFNPVDKGGMPPGFPLGIMKMPTPDGAACPDCKTLGVGGGFVVNAATPRPALAAAFLATLTTPEFGTQWREATLAQGAVGTGSVPAEGDHAQYYRDLAAANRGAVYFLGAPIQHLKGACLDAFTQIVNTALPGGMIGVDKAIEMMDAACYRPS